MSEIYKKLSEIYKKYHPQDIPSRESQLGVLWDITDPPENLELTEPLRDIETRFDIEIFEDEAVELFDMNLGEASTFIEKMMRANNE